MLKREGPLFDPVQVKLRASVFLHRNVGALVKSYWSDKLVHWIHLGMMSIIDSISMLFVEMGLWFWRTPHPTIHSQSVVCGPSRTSALERPVVGAPLILFDKMRSEQSWWRAWWITTFFVTHNCWSRLMTKINPCWTSRRMCTGCFLDTAHQLRFFCEFEVFVKNQMGCEILMRASLIQIIRFMFCHDQLNGNCLII